MLNFEQIIPLAARTAADKPIIAAPYALPEGICRSLAGAGLIGGYIAEDRPNTPPQDRFVAGWWTDRSRGNWFIRPSGARTMILLSGSPESDLGGRMLLEARLKGIQRILLIGGDGSISKEINVEGTLLERLSATPADNPLHRLSYEDLFEDMYALVGDRLRLPTSAFASDRVLLLIGSLEAGGAERQASYTAAGLGKRFPGQIYLGRGRAGTPALDFFKSAVESAGVATCVVREWAPEYSSPEILHIRSELEARYRELGGLNIFYQAFHYALLIRDIRPALVHTWQEYSNISGGIAADWVGVPRLVLSGRSMAPDNFNIFQPYMAPGYRALLKNRRPIFLNNSAAGAADYARWLGVPLEHFRVLHNGFEFPDIPTEARNETRRRLGIPENAIVVGKLTRFGEEKRPELWMDMALAVHRTHPDAYFLVFGTGPLLEACRAFVTANGLADRVKLPGVTQEAWAALTAMDVFVLTSRMEGLPNVVVEAQGAGLPVVCTSGGGITETFVDGETGLVVHAATAEGLAAAVRRLIDDPELRRRMGQNAYRHAREQFGIDRMLDETIAAYGSTVDHVNDFRWTPDERDAISPTDIRLGGILREQGHCFHARLPRGVDLAGMNLVEDDHVLGPAEADRAKVIELGEGRHQIAEDDIFFSSSDNSDPRFNGRSYRLHARDWEPQYEVVTIPKDAIVSELGNCYIAQLGLEPGWVRFELREDDRRIGPGGCLHDEVRSAGGGRYSVWNADLYFSTSDNSDPRTNGRAYGLRRSKKPAAFSETTLLPTGSSLEQVMRHLARSAIPRQDFVPGRLVHIGGSLGPGGAERQILYTLKGLAQRPFESIQLLCSYMTATQKERHDFYVPAFKEAGIPVRTIRRDVGPDDLDAMPAILRAVAASLPNGLAADIANLYWEFIELRPEIVHSWLDGNNERAGMAAALAGVPRIVVSGRNVNPTHFAFYQPYMDATYKALLDLPQVTMINNSEAGRDDYAEWLGIDRRRIGVVYNGIDLPDRSRPSEERKKEIRRKLSLDPDAFVTGGVFRFAPEKRPLLWIETAAEVARVIPEAQFILFGLGDMRPQMEELVRERGLVDRLVFAGVTPEILDAISVMDVFLLSSAAEGVPNVVLEAQWVGTPVVATRAGGTAEAVEIGSTGWIVESPSADELAACIRRLHANPEERLKARTRGQAFVKKRFSVEQMLAKTLDVYRTSGGRSDSRLW